MTFTDRVSDPNLSPKRKKIKLESALGTIPAGTEFFAEIDYADNPSTEGTPLNAASLNSLRTQLLYDSGRIDGNTSSGVVVPVSQDPNNFSIYIVEASVGASARYGDLYMIPRHGTYNSDTKIQDHLGYSKAVQLLSYTTNTMTLAGYYIDIGTTAKIYALGVFRIYGLV